MISTLTWNRTIGKDSPEEMSDERLIARVSRGDSAAMRTLYARYSSVALGLALRVLGDRATAEEIVQEAFWRVWRRSRSFKHGRGSFCTWLFSIVHHLAIDELRRRRSRAATGTTEIEDDKLLDLPDARADVPLQVLRRLAGEQVRLALSRLPENQRRVLELAYFQGMTHQEISQTLGEPLGTIHTRTRTALCRLRALASLAALVES